MTNQKSSGTGAGYLSSNSAPLGDRLRMMHSTMPVGIVMLPPFKVLIRGAVLWLFTGLFKRIDLPMSKFKGQHRRGKVCRYYLEIAVHNPLSCDGRDGCYALPR